MILFANKQKIFFLSMYFHIFCFLSCSIHFILLNWSFRILVDLVQKIIQKNICFKNSRTARDFGNIPCEENEVEVVHLVVLRNVYNNEVIRKKDANESYIFQLENVWIDECPFDDYSVLGAKKIVDRVFGSMNASDFTAEVAGKTSLKVCGAVYLKGKIYVLTQIIFPDYFPSMPYNLRKEKIYDLYSVQTIGDDDINSFLERRVFQTLAIV